MKRLPLIAVLSLAVAGASFALEAGGGISVFVPQSLYQYKQGSISVETNFEYSVGLSKILSFPIGISYNKIYGYLPGGTGLDQVSTPWFFGDSIMGYVMAKVHLPIWIFYLNLYGGGAANWNVTLAPVGQSIESYLASAASANAAAFPNPSYKAPFGYGWVAGAGFGVAIKKFRVDLSATYRDVRSPLTLTGTYYTVTDSGGSATATAASYEAPSNAALIMKGISIGVNVHVSL